jgi:hypothetical protein
MGVVREGPEIIDRQHSWARGDRWMMNVLVQSGEGDWWVDTIKQEGGQWMGTKLGLRLSMFCP